MWVRSPVRKIPWKSMATHSSILAWRIPWTEEPGGLQRVGHDWELNTGRDQRACFSLSLSLSIISGHSKEVATYKPRSKFSPEPTASTLTLGFQPPEQGEITVAWTTQSLLVLLHQPMLRQTCWGKVSGKRCRRGLEGKWGLGNCLREESAEPAVGSTVTPTAGTRGNWGWASPSPAAPGSGPGKRRGGGRGGQPCVPTRGSPPHPPTLSGQDPIVQFTLVV